MKKDKEKPKWGKPKLIVLIKGGGQESVLQTCKQAPFQMGGLPSGNDAGGCYVWTGSCPLCSDYFTS